MKKMKKLFLFALPLAAVMMLASCRNDAQREGAVIPRNASIVVTTNLQTLAQKGDLAKAKDMNTIKGLRQELRQSSPELDNLVGALMDDPARCGLDLKRNVTLFAANPEDNPFAFNIVVSAWVASQKKFDTFLSDLKKNGGLDYETTDLKGLTGYDFEDFYAVSNGDRILFVLSSMDDDKYYDLPEEALIEYDEEADTHIFDAFEEAAEGEEAAIEETDGNNEVDYTYATNLFNLKQEESMAADKDFASFWKQRADISVYSYYGGIFSDFGRDMMSEGTKELLDDMKDTRIYYNIAFEKGSIDITGGAYNMSERMRELVDHDFNKQVVDYMPAQALIAFTFGADLGNYLDLYAKILGLNVNEKSGIKDYTLDDLVDAFEGSVALAFSGMKDGMPHLTLAADVDETAVVKAILEEAGFAQQGDIYSHTSAPVWACFDDDIVLVSSDPAYASFEKGKSLDGIAAKAKKGNYFYIDLDLQHYSAELLDWLGSNPMMEAVLALFDHAELGSVDATHSEGHIYMSDKKMNSLAYILHSVDKMI